MPGSRDVTAGGKSRVVGSHGQQVASWRSLSQLDLGYRVFALGSLTSLPAHLAIVCRHRRLTGASQHRHQGTQQEAPRSRHAWYRSPPLPEGVKGVVVAWKEDETPGPAAQGSVKSSRRPRARHRAIRSCRQSIAILLWDWEEWRA